MAEEGTHGALAKQIFVNTDSCLLLRAVVASNHPKRFQDAVPLPEPRPHASGWSLPVCLWAIPQATCRPVPPHLVCRSSYRSGIIEGRKFIVHRYCRIQTESALLLYSGSPGMCFFIILLAVTMLLFFFPLRKYGEGPQNSLFPCGWL